MTRSDVAIVADYLLSVSVKSKGPVISCYGSTVLSNSGCTTMLRRRYRKNRYRKRRYSQLDAAMTGASWSLGRPCRCGCLLADNWMQI